MTLNKDVILCMTVILLAWNSVSAIWKCTDETNQVSSNSGEQLPPESTQPSTNENKNVTCGIEFRQCKSNTDCCSGKCKSTGQCDCLRNGEKCDLSVACCSNNCQFGNTCGCNEDNRICTSEAECCSGFCIKANSTDLLGTCTKCRAVGEQCLADSINTGTNGCCSSLCSGDGKCEASLPGGACNDDTHCNSQKGRFIVKCVNNRCECNSVGAPCNVSNLASCCFGLGTNTCNPSTNKCE